MFSDMFILGILGGNDSDVYEEDMTVQRFRDNYETIVSDLDEDENTLNAARAFNKISSDYPTAVKDNAQSLFNHLDNSNIEVQINCMSALVKADAEIDERIVGRETIDMLNTMLESKSSEIRRDASHLLALGVKECEHYYVYGEKIRTAMQDQDNLVTRLRAAQALRYYVDRTRDTEQAAHCSDTIMDNFKPAFNNMENDYWNNMIKQLLVLSKHLVLDYPDFAERLEPVITTAKNTQDAELMLPALKIVQNIASSSPSKFIEMEPTIRPFMSSDLPDILNVAASSAYKFYSEQENVDATNVSHVVDDAFEQYKSLDGSDDHKPGRVMITGFLSNMVNRGVGMSHILKNVHVFERELELETSQAEISTLELYISAVNQIGPEPLVGHVSHVPKYMNSNDPYVREMTATILMSFVEKNPDVLEKNDVDIEKMKSILRNHSDEIDDVDRVFENLQKNSKSSTNLKSESVEDTEDEYLKQTPDSDFTEYIGMSELKDEAERKIIEPLKEPELHDEFGVDIQRGFLFYGPPGTGKTYFAKSLAGEFDLSYIEIDAADLVSKFIGEGAENVSNMFDVAAENEPCLVFIDEIDAIATDRDSQQTKSERQMVNQMLQSISRINDKEHDVVVVGATNRIDDVDSAILRSGRLGEKIEFTEPEAETRVKIFREYCKPDTSQVDEEWLMEETEGMVQSDVTELASKSSYNALEAYRNGRDEKLIHEEDVKEALEDIKNTRDQDEPDYKI